MHRLKPLLNQTPKMVETTTTIINKSPLISRFVGFPHKPTSHLCSHTGIRTNSVRKTGFRASSSYICHPYSSNSTFGDLGHSRNELKQMGFRFSAVADGGSGGFGGSGDGSSGGDGDSGSGGAGDKWSLLSWYLNLLEKYPVLTKAVTSALLTFVGDLICQLVIDKAPSLDLKRISLFTLLGLVMVGPTLHFWYLALSKLVTRPGASGAFLRLVLDQFLFSPIFIGAFLSTLITLEGRPSQIVPKLQQEWFSAVLANWQLWIPFQFLNFRFVPQQFQVLAANVIALVWNVILSFKAHKEVLQK